MSGNDLVVDGALLDSSASSLGAIKAALDGLGRRRDAARDIWGSPRIGAAMDDVVDNWDGRRRELAGKIDALREMTETASEHFTEIDSSLADEMRSAARS